MDKKVKTGNDLLEFFERITVQKGFKKDRLEEILNDNTGYFEKNLVLNCNPFDFLQEKILNLNSGFQYPKNNLESI
ncbi:unnamed protein product, partial [marine sediment metagenome]